MEQGNARGVPLGGATAELFFQGGVVEIAVAEGVGVGGTEVDATNPGPVGGGIAHAAALRAGVENATGKVMGAEAAAGLTDGDDFSVGAGIAGGEDPVATLADDPSVFDDDGAKGTATSFDQTTDPAQFNGASHKAGVGGGVACTTHQAIEYSLIHFMGTKLSGHRYGKSRVRVVKILRDGPRHTVVEINAQVLLEGDFESSYTAGDNSKVVATDTVKNTVHVLAKDHLTPEVERFAVHLARHFTSKYPQVQKAVVEIRQRTWERMENHDHCFTAPGSPTPWVKAEHAKGAKEAAVESGVKEWLILKSAQSGFENYPKCELTTLPETNDRIFATAVTVGWKWAQEPKDYLTANRRILEAMQGPFMNKFSPSVQTTMYEMGEEALKACAEISEVSLAMPNKHCLLFNLKPFGMENPNVIFTATDEPHGQIEAVIRRN